MEKTDWLWPGGVRYVYDEAAFRPGTDTFLLGAFPKLWRGARVCDLGAGIGLLGLLLLAREPSLRVTNVELQAHAATRRRTASRSKLPACGPTCAIKGSCRRRGASTSWSQTRRILPRTAARCRPIRRGGMPAPRRAARSRTT